MLAVRRLKWLIDLAIDYGSIALVVMVAAIYLSGTVTVLLQPSAPHDGSAIATVLGMLLAALAVKL